MEAYKTLDLSLIIICYNFEKVIRKALDSVISQTYLPKQLIIIDDGSTDNSKDVINDWVNKNAKIFRDIQLKLIFKENEGLVKTLNKAVSFATHKYVSFLSGDDEMDSKRNEILFLEIENRKGIDAVFSSYYEKDILNDKIRLVTIRISENFNSLSYRDRIRSVFTKTSFWIGSGIFKKIVFEKILFDTKYRNLEDMPFKLNLIKNFKIAMIDIPLTTYNLFNNNMTRVRDKEITRDSIRLAFEYRNALGNIYFLMIVAKYLSNYFYGLYLKNKSISALILSILIYPTKIKIFIPNRVKKWIK